MCVILRIHLFFMGSLPLLSAGVTSLSKGVGGLSHHLPSTLLLFLSWESELLPGVWATGVHQVALLGASEPLPDGKESSGGQGEGGGSLQGFLPCQGFSQEASQLPRLSCPVLLTERSVNARLNQLCCLVPMSGVHSMADLAKGHPLCTWD